MCVCVCVNWSVEVGDFTASSFSSSCYANQIVPYLVYLCDEPFTEAVAHLVHTPLPDLLRSCLPSSMVLILTNYAQQDRGDNEESSQERRSRAKASHDLLIEYLTEEVCSSFTTCWLPWELNCHKFRSISTGTYV